MALEFYKRRIRVPSKRMQYILAFSALLLVLALLFCWMTIRHKLDERQQNSTSSDNSSSAISADAFTADDEGYLLLIIGDEDVTRFILVNADPANNAIRVTAVAEDAVTSDGMTLTPLYQKNGAARVVSLLASAADIPLRHYAAVSTANTERWFSRFEGGINMTLPESVTLGTHEEGDDQVFEAGEHTLGSGAATDLLIKADGQVGVQVITAMLGQYLREGRYLSSDFSFLANIAQTSLRIGDFNDYRSCLEHLANQNTQGNCSFTTHTFAQ